MKHWHNGPISKCGQKFQCLVSILPPLFIVEWRDRGYYAGWIEDELWEMLKAQGRVTQLPWWRIF